MNYTWYENRTLLQCPDKQQILDDAMDDIKDSLYNLLEDCILLNVDNSSIIENVQLLLNQMVR